MAIDTGKQENETQEGEAKDARPGINASDVILDSAAQGEGVRVAFIGDSGGGKTYAMVRVVENYLKRTRGCALIVDDKERVARFKGQERVDVADVAKHPPQPEPRAIVFRGSGMLGKLADPEEVAAYGWRIAASGLPVLVVADELERAASNGQWRRGVTWIPRIFGQGRANGVSMFWGAQSPQMAPLEAFEQSSHMLVFKLDAMGTGLLERRGYLSSAQALQVSQFPGMEVEKAKRGFFLLVTRGVGVSGPYKF